MKLKNKIAALSTLLMFQSFSAVNAAEVDREIAIFAAEQDRTEEVVEPFDPKSLEDDKNKPKTKDEIKAEEKRIEDERKAAKKKIKEERKKSRDELKGKAPISKNPAPVERKQVNNSPAITPPTPTMQAVQAVEEFNTTEGQDNPQIEEDIQPVEDVKPVTEPPRNIGLPNPIISYASFNEIVQAMNFTPLYIPKKSGYTITAMMTIDNKIAEIRYSRKWEPNVSLHVRTYRRTAGEELKDISGVVGVKWRVNVANGITTYIAKISENKHVAAWAVGNYTFSAYVENLSFAAFHALVADELVDLSNHYYIGN